LKVIPLTVENLIEQAAHKQCAPLAPSGENKYIAAAEPANGRFDDL